MLFLYHRVAIASKFKIENIFIEKLNVFDLFLEFNQGFCFFMNKAQLYFQLYASGFVPAKCVLMLVLFFCYVVVYLEINAVYP